MKALDCIVVLRALGEENRIRIMREIMRGGGTVGEIADKTAVSVYNVSKHLRVLREAGLVKLTKQGRYRHFVLSPEFSEPVTKDKGVLDLGCCRFDFRKWGR